MSATSDFDPTHVSTLKDIQYEWCTIASNQSYTCSYIYELYFIGVRYGKIVYY